MEQLKNHFNRITREQPFWSSLICFNNVMYTRKYSDSEIINSFKKLVEKGDYPRKHFDELIEQAIFLNREKRGF